MGLLRWLGIEKYLKKVKAYVDAQDKRIQDSIQPYETPDWNAEQGEEGYIKNKPFGDSIDNKIEVPADFDPDMTSTLVVQLPYFSMGIYVKYPMCNPLSGDVYGYDVLNAVHGLGSCIIEHPAGNLAVGVTPSEYGAYLVIENINLDNAYLVDYITYKQYEEAETTTIITRVSPMYLPEGVEMKKASYLCDVAQFGGGNIMDSDFASDLINAIVQGRPIDVKMSDEVTFSVMGIHRVMGSNDAFNVWDTIDPFNNTFSLTAVVNNGSVHVFSVFFDNWGGEWYCIIEDKEL